MASLLVTKKDHRRLEISRDLLEAAQGYFGADYMGACDTSSKFSLT